MFHINNAVNKLNARILIQVIHQAYIQRLLARVFLIKI